MAIAISRAVAKRSLGSFESPRSTIASNALVLGDTRLGAETASCANLRHPAGGDLRVQGVAPDDPNLLGGDVLHPIQLERITVR